MRGTERLAEPRGRLPNPAALGFQLCEAKLECGGHPVERIAQLGELVTTANVDTPAEPALRDRVCGVDQTCERAHDRVSKEIRRDAEQHERGEQRHEDRPLGRARGRIDAVLRCERGKRDASGQLGGLETAVLDRSNTHARRASRCEVELAACSRDDARPAHDDKPVAVLEPAGERLQRQLVQRHGDGDPAEQAAAVDDRNGARPVTEMGARHAGQDLLDRALVMAAQRPLQLRLGRELLGGEPGGVEPGRVPRDGPPKPGLERGIGAAGLAPLGERVVAVKRDRKRQQRKERKPENQLELEASHWRLKA